MTFRKIADFDPVVTSHKLWTKISDQISPAEVTSETAGNK